MRLPPPARGSEPAVTFWGAAQNVTGSMHLLEWNGRRVLLDCGQHRGPRHHDLTAAHGFPFEPPSVSAVVLSHAHMDHCGNLPNLVKQGFSGPIFCTPATRDLVELMLLDSARHQEREAQVLRLTGRAETPEYQSLFNQEDVDATLYQCRELPLGQEAEVAEGVRLRFAEAGHILGSAMVALALGGDRRVTFTGDLGRPGLPLLRDPEPIPAGDLVLCESTYGGRQHEPFEQTVAKLGRILEVTRARGGKILIPSFSLGRAQLVVYVLQEGMRSGRFPRLPLYVDSPTAGDIAAIHRDHVRQLDPAAVRLAEAGLPLLDGDGVTYLHTSEESRAVSEERDPCVVVASGGMCEGGRILRHLERNLDDPRASVVLISYQAPHSLGRKLLERGPTVRFHGRKWNKWIEVHELPGFSGHAGHDDLLSALRPLTRAAARVRLIHGEVEAATTLARDLAAAGFADVAVPARGECVAV